MRGWPNEVKETAISLLKEEYQLLKSEEAATPQETNMMHSYPIGGFKSRLFGLDEKDKSDDELNATWIILEHPKLLLKRIHSSGGLIMNKGSQLYLK
jgi:hypothetical protein